MASRVDTAAVRPLVILFTIINLTVTWIFNADVVAQGGAYATGVLVLISSAVRGHGDRSLSKAPRILDGADALGTGGDHGRVFLYGRGQHGRAARWDQDRELVHHCHRRGLVRIAAETEHRAAFQGVRVRRFQLEIPVGQSQAFGISGAGSPSARPAGCWKKRPAFGAGIDCRTRCRSCSSKPNWAIPANFSTAR